MQGIRQFIPTEKKIAYINHLLRVGYEAIDFGSFVSHEKIPQMADTGRVVDGLNLDHTTSRLIAIVANERGAQQACAFEKIHSLGFPFSVSETFQRRNANSTIEEAVDRVKVIKDLTEKHHKELIIYLSMGFGNPYGDVYHPDIVVNWTDKLSQLGIRIFMLSDTVGVGEPKGIRELFSRLTPAFPDLEFGAHLHTAPHNWRVKIDAAFQNGCRRFDAAIKGYGGCPMADDDLIGNMPTENLINYFTESQIEGNFNLSEFEKCLRESSKVFPLHS